MPFRVAYCDAKAKKAFCHNLDLKVQDSNTKDYLQPNRTKEIVSYIVDNFTHCTRRGKGYEARINKKLQYTRSFNSMLAFDSVNMLKLYYDTFKKVKEEGKPT